jgi:hypothetical protein
MRAAVTAAVAVFNEKSVITVATGEGDRDDDEFEEDDKGEFFISCEVRGEEESCSE